MTTNKERIESVRDINQNLQKYHIDNLEYDAVKQLKKILLEYIINGTKMTTSIYFTEFNKYINVKLCSYDTKRNNVVLSLKKLY